MFVHPGAEIRLNKAIVMNLRRIMSIQWTAIQRRSVYNSPRILRRLCVVFDSPLLKLFLYHMWHHHTQQPMSSFGNPIIAVLTDVYNKKDRSLCYTLFNIHFLASFCRENSFSFRSISTQMVNYVSHLDFRNPISSLQPKNECHCCLLALIGMSEAIYTGSPPLLSSFPLRSNLEETETFELGTRRSPVNLDMPSFSNPDSDISSGFLLDSELIRGSAVSFGNTSINPVIFQSSTWFARPCQSALCVSTSK